MAIFLLILIGVGAVLAVISLFSSAEDTRIKESQVASQGALERTLRQLRDQVLTVELDVKKNTRLALEVQADLREIKEKHLPSLSETISRQSSPGVVLPEPGQKQNLAVTDTAERIIALEEENKRLADRVASLSAQIDELTEERDAQEQVIFQLREREARIREQLQRLQAECEDLKKGLEEATKSKLEMKDKLVKLKVISADNEKELERLRTENKGLMDHLSYERNR
jgi:chromosome segregation ATPase